MVWRRNERTGDAMCDVMNVNKAYDDWPPRVGDVWEYVHPRHEYRSMNTVIEPVNGAGQYRVASFCKFEGQKAFVCIRRAVWFYNEWMTGCLRLVSRL